MAGHVNARGTEEIRFWSKVQILDSGCWIWTASKTRGYGWFALTNYDSKPHCDSILAHDWSYEYCIGPIPQGLEPDHLCRTPACVNPWHLELVTRKINVRRGVSPCAIHAAKTVCIRGHNDWYIRPDGTGRLCKTCNRINKQQRKNSQ